MAGQEQHGSADRERPSRRDSSPATVVVAPSARPGFAPRSLLTATTEPTRSAPTQAPRAVSRLLQIRGLDPHEATRLAAFAYGLPADQLDWKLAQLNTLLFLRHQQRNGRFGGDDGGRDLLD